MQVVLSKKDQAMIIPEKLTGELACILEDCGPPDRQSPEALAELIRHYQPTWDRIAAALAANYQEAWVAALLNAPNPTALAATTEQLDKLQFGRVLHERHATPDRADDLEFLDLEHLDGAATPAVGGEALDHETIQTLLDLLNPLHGALDYQIHVNSEGEHVYDAPPDYEHHVIVLAQQDRDLTQAVLILENRRALPASPLRGRESMITALAEKFEQRPSKRTVEYATECVDAMLAASPPEQPAAGDGETKA